MKKILFVLWCMILCIPTVASAKFYNLGNGLKVSAYRFEGDNYFILSFTDDEDDLRLGNNPILKIKMTDGTVIRLTGSDDPKFAKTSPHLWKFGVLDGDGFNTHMVIYYITPEDIDKLQAGIEKVMLNTIPDVYLRTFKSDKVGKQLYDDYKKEDAPF